MIERVKAKRLAVAIVVTMMMQMLVLPMSRAYGAIDEREPNDSFATATTISMNTVVYGMYDCDRDVDYYKVQLPASGSIKIVFTNDEYSGSDTRWELFVCELYNKYYESMGYTKIWCDTTRPDSITYKLPKGACYIKVFGGGGYGGCNPGAGHPYHFRLVYQVPSTSVRTLRPARNSVTVSYVRKSNVLKYQIRYSIHRNMSGAKTVEASRTAGARVVRGLRSNRRYYFQVRVAKKIGTQTYWSAWSPRKTAVAK